NVTTMTTQPMLLGVLCNMWKVEYQQQHICAVKGSSVAVLCSFHRPDSQTVEKVMWGHVKAPDSKGRLIVDSNSRKVSKRFQYIGDKHDNCSLKINQVEHKYAGIYTVRIIYNKKDSLPGYKPSPRLKVVGKFFFFSENISEAVKEGDSVNVTCINSCDGGNISSVFTWFKDGESINEGPVLYLTNISSANSGNYTCSLKAHRGTTSRVVHINVEGGPKNTSVFIRPSVEGDDSSSLILTCSSHANPPVENYTWFKMVGDDILDVGHQSVLFPGDGGCYFCCATNKHGSQNSSAVTLNIKHLTMIVTKPSEKETMKEGDTVNVTCVNSCDDGRKRSSEFIWFKDGESIIEGPVLHLINMSYTNSGNYTCSLKTHTGTTSGVKHIDVECEYWTRAPTARSSKQRMRKKTPL
uniref:Ig-like domain-containing protein n=1 Tax=Amphiprion percula TaxID=161767 RepID=A0A3P8RWU2_AMPPE